MHICKRIYDAHDVVIDTYLRQIVATTTDVGSYPQEAGGSFSLYKNVTQNCHCIDMITTAGFLH